MCPCVLCIASNFNILKRMSIVELPYGVWGHLICFAFEMHITHNQTGIRIKMNIFLQFARGFRRLSDKIHSNRTYGQCIAFFAVCIVKISAVSSIVSPPPFIPEKKKKQNKNCIENFYSEFFVCILFSSFLLLFHALVRIPFRIQYEFYTERNCYSNATFQRHTDDGMYDVKYEHIVDDCDYNVAMNVSWYAQCTQCIGDDSLAQETERKTENTKS